MNISKLINWPTLVIPPENGTVMSEMAELLNKNIFIHITTLQERRSHVNEECMAKNNIFPALFSLKLNY